ncbi:MAG: hypothetical protein Q4F71_13280 [Paracoccus sp. (in: a-proteobacteria)]|nr:hypothetical protein [Paracoccus sp. (in: a-proteobacteria)]
MQNIRTLTPDEPIVIDSHRIAQIRLRVGPDADDLVCQALEQIAAGSARLHRAARDGDTRGTGKEAARLSRLAGQIGLVSLAGVAADVFACTRLGDPAALAATLERARRVTDRSLSAIGDWETAG